MSGLSDALAGQASAAGVEAVLAQQASGLAPEELSELSAVLERYLNSLPAGLTALAAMAKDPHVGRGVAFAAGNVLLYVVDEDDFLPESEVGGVGLLDDAYLVHRCIGALRAAFPQLGAPDGYQPPDERADAAVRSLLPDGVSDALDRTCENLARVAALFVAGGGAAPGQNGDERPPLRVDAAVDALREAF